MFDPAESLSTTTMISDFIPVREECYKLREGEQLGSVNQRCRRDALKIPGDGTVKMAWSKSGKFKSMRGQEQLWSKAEEDEQLRRRREVARVEARKYIQLQMKKGGGCNEGLDFNPAAGERDRLRSLFEQETATISGQREHMERYIKFGEKYRKMSKEKGWRFDQLTEIFAKIHPKHIIGILLHETSGVKVPQLKYYSKNGIFITLEFSDLL